MSAASSLGKSHLLLGLFGLLMGYSLYFIGFSNYDEVHKLFLLEDLRLLLTFAGAVLLAAVGFAVAARGRSLPGKKIHKGTIIGGVIFGAGWAISGACPSIALVQLGSGYLPALATVAGIITGIWLFKKLKPKYFRWDTGACEL